MATKEYDNLQKERINNGKEIAQNLRTQIASLDQQGKNNELYLEDRQSDYRELTNRANWSEFQKELFFIKDIDKETGVGNIRFRTNIDWAKQIENRNGIELIGGTDENGVLKYSLMKDDFEFSASNAEEFLKNLTKQNADNSMLYNADQQFEILKAFGYLTDDLRDTNGNLIFANGIANATKEEREAAVKTLLDDAKAFLDKIEQTEDDMQALQEEGKSLEGQVIDIKNQIQDNEIELENKLMQAIEDREQFRIDE